MIMTYFSKLLQLSSNVFKHGFKLSLTKREKKKQGVGNRNCLLIIIHFPFSLFLWRNSSLLPSLTLYLLGRHPLLQSGSFTPAGAATGNSLRTSLFCSLFARYLPVCASGLLLFLLNGGRRLQRELKCVDL
ncbi:hypothetical protein L1887_20925 [Cichorium endivia]|nr:hypothetical protein L1887_20925 [Cichorium endivia]